MAANVRVLLISTYESGHQPLHLASPAAALRRAGHDVDALDLSVQDADPGALAWAEAVAFSVPMHTAMRLALPVARRLRRRRPRLPVCFYGLYAPVSRDLTLGALADRVIAGEYEPALVAWVDGMAVAAGRRRAPAPDPVPAPAADAVVHLGRGRFPVPARDLLPPLDRYARLAIAGERRLVGYVEASHGCSHRCRHCPVPSVYDGRIRVVGEDVVLADVAQLVAMGARHVTFGDPDFLNGVHHSLRVVRALHHRFPDLTFDCTTKVEHVLRHRGVWEELAAAGCLFVVSAFECVNDAILRRLDKGHTAAEAAEAVALLRRHGIEVRPSFLPFTPWTTVGDVVDILDFVAAHDLVDNVDAVQYTIRLLLPEGSLLLDHPALAPHLGPYDAEHLGYRWSAADPAVDRLQEDLAVLVEDSLRAGETAATAYARVRAAAVAALPAPPARPRARVPAPVDAGGWPRPRLTEPWFC